MSDNAMKAGAIFFPTANSNPPNLWCEVKKGKSLRIVENSMRYNGIDSSWVKENR
jgi:hypothetical protein